MFLGPALQSYNVNFNNFSGPFPPLPTDVSNLVILTATGISGANGSFPLNAAGEPLPSALRFNKE